MLAGYLSLALLCAERSLARARRASGKRLSAMMAAQTLEPTSTISPCRIRSLGLCPIAIRSTRLWKVHHRLNASGSLPPLATSTTRIRRSQATFLEYESYLRLSDESRLRLGSLRPIVAALGERGDAVGDWVYKVRRNCNPLS
jgi:hypothetical protein